MKRTILVLLALAGIGLNATVAGSCGYRSYSSYSYSPSYNYSASYGSGSYYWPGGYWYGGGGYASGYYPAGSYRNYGYDQYNHYEQPYYVKYKAVIPLVELPTYGAYYQEPPAVASAPCTMRAAATSAPSSYPSGAATASYATGADSKLDRILVLTEQTSGRLVRVEARLDVLEGKRSPAPELATKPPIGSPTMTPAASPTPATGEKPDGPTVLYTRCASCHEAKVVAKSRSKVTLFATGPDGPEIASVNAKGELEPLPIATLKNAEKAIAEGTMPPAKDLANRPLEPLSTAEQKIALEFLRQAIAGVK